jgi:hypothetical protein
MRAMIASVSLLLALLTACAARIPIGSQSPSRAGDDQLTCEAIGDEMTVNARRIQRIDAALIDMERRRGAGIGSHGGFIDPDDRRQAQEDIRAYEARNARLAELGEQKRCPRPPGR